jgi:hypothetical protein
MKTMAAVITLTATVWIAGCGGEKAASSGGGGSEPPAATVEPAEPATVACAALMPADELRAVLGVDPERTDENAYPGSTTCRWSYVPEGSIYKSFLQIVTATNDPSGDMWRAMHTDEARMDSRTPGAVPGIGDEAYAWVGQADYRRLYVRKGSKTLVIRGPVSLPALTAEPAMAKLAATLLARY